MCFRDCSTSCLIWASRLMMRFTVCVFFGTLPHSWKVFKISLCNSVDEGIIWTVSVKNSVPSEEARRQSNSSTWHLDVLLLG
ncbi:unnamed protein product, partial [Brassica oleracea]